MPAITMQGRTDSLAFPRIALFSWREGFAKQQIWQATPRVGSGEDLTRLGRLIPSVPSLTHGVLIGTARTFEIALKETSFAVLLLPMIGLLLAPFRSVHT